MRAALLVVTAMVAVPGLGCRRRVVKRPPFYGNLNLPALVEELLNPDDSEAITRMQALPNGGASERGDGDVAVKHWNYVLAFEGGAPRHTKLMAKLKVRIEELLGASSLRIHGRTQEADGTGFGFHYGASGTEGHIYIYSVLQEGNQLRVIALLHEH